MGNPSIERLNRLISEPRLRRLAGPNPFERGQKYFAEGRVHSLRFDRQHLYATVIGSEPYRVAVWEDQGDLEYSCSCPVGRETAFCKHCVATALAWLAQEGDAKPKATNLEDIRAFLCGQPASELVDMIMAGLGKDDRLVRELSLRMSRAAAPRDAQTWRKVIDEAIGDAASVGYEGPGDVAERLDEVVDSLESLLAEGHGVLVLELAEYTLESVDELLDEIDDYEGEVRGSLERAQTLHFSTCEQAPPDPEELAERLFGWEMSFNSDVFYGAIRSYADLVGEVGLQKYRSLAEAEWAKIPTREPGASYEIDDGARSRITSIMETLAELTGRVDDWVAIRRRDLSQPHDFLAIAQACKNAGRAEDALDWAMRGCKAFAKRSPDRRLAEFLADALSDAGRAEEAVATAWTLFAEQPGIEEYKFLKRQAERAKSWETRRNAALAFIRDSLWMGEAPGTKKRAAPLPRPAKDDHSLLVQIFLWEGDPETAWHEAQAGGCSHELWLQLAQSLEKTRPLEAVAIYRARVPRILARAGQQAYEEAGGYLMRVKALLLDCGRQEELSGYVEEIRRDHKQKRNFIKLLDQKCW